MARRLCAVVQVLPLILVISFLLFEVFNCSRPLSPEERQPRVLSAPAAAPRDEPHPRGAAETGTRPVTVATTEDDGSRAGPADDDDDAAPPWSARASPRDKDQAYDGVGSRHKNALLGPPVLQRSKLARRFLAGVVDGADSAARASCHSSDVHISCTPPSEH